MDPYNGYDPSMLSHTLEGHGNAVWGLAFSPTTQRLASCSDDDGTIRIWDPSTSSPTCLYIFPTDCHHRIPTSVAITSTECAHIMASFRSGHIVLYDLEAKSALLTLESRGSSDPTQINQVVTHPNQPFTITIHDDRGICFLGNWTGKFVHSMAAHLDNHMPGHGTQWRIPDVGNPRLLPLSMEAEQQNTHARDHSPLQET